MPEVPGGGRDRGPAVPALPGHGACNTRRGGLAMASGRPRQPNDPGIMASVETAMSTVARPGLIARVWHWRYELGLITGLVLGTAGIGITLGPGWLIGVAAAALAIVAAALILPPSRQPILDRAWCDITPVRLRTGDAPA